MMQGMMEARVSDRVEGNAAAPSRWPAGVWLGLMLTVSIVWLGFGFARRAASHDPLLIAWQAAKSAGQYAFEGSSVSRIGDRSAAHRMKGSGDLRGELLLSLLGDARAETRYRMLWPEAWVGLETEDARWEAVDPHSLALALPLGDPMVLLVVGQAARPGPIEIVGGQDCRRVDFRVGGRAYAAWWLDNMEFWPVNADSGGLHTFSAEATLWQDPLTHLPCRIRASTVLPRLGGAQPGSAEMDWVYSDWRRE